MDKTAAATFKKLKQTPINEMLDRYNDVSVNIPRLTRLGGGGGRFGLPLHDHLTNTFRPEELVIHHLRIKLLEDNGWTFDEFVTEIERNAIIQEIRLHNESISFPPSLLDRARQFFPDLVYKEAEIILEKH